MMEIQAALIREEGNSIFIQCAPAVALLGVSSFVDHTSGEDEHNFFDKFFRYSVNGIDYTEFAPLTLEQLSGLNFTGNDIVWFELQYYKRQANSHVPLQVNGVSFTPSGQGALKDTPLFAQSIFARFFQAYDIEVVRWYMNVLQKLYEKGIIPNYMDRFDAEKSNADFISFWESIAHFVAYLVIYARKFQAFYKTDFLLSDYLEQRGLAVSEHNSLSEMNELMEHFYQHIAYRGTKHIYDKSELGAAIDGELLRLINYRDDEDELLFNLYKPEHFGWNIGNASPLYKGLHLNDNINKSYETHFDVRDISKYPVFGNVTVARDQEKSVMAINQGGINSSDPAWRIKVDSRLDYEISFFIKTEKDSRLTVGANTFSKTGNPLSCRSYKDGTDTNYFFDGIQLVRDDCYLQVKLFIYNRNRKTFAHDTTEVKQGNDLIFHEDAVYLIPEIRLSGAGKLWGLRILPMQTSYSRGLIQVNNFISVWLRNRNHAYAMEQVKDYITRYLVPYNSWMALSDVGDAGYNELEEAPETFYWLPEAPYCETTAWRPVGPSCELKDLVWEPEIETAYCETREGGPNPKN
ncbi:hypothetical protein [Chitinophaga arvensicola]|uniref:Uncharacterized protein n=1 Tax=Chitinophaga arvensicola TaxID=29529 RepID=A0A1I0R9L4_9BACT|nr:hypothetical protein [Chitinophaga arvensicola]SEW37505.1 hypothetical protein SAMN04488122_2514 [Chitinophaga arvensicola]